MRSHPACQTDWHYLKPFSTVATAKRELRGQTYSIQTSLFYMPDAVRGCLDEREHEGTIEFLYGIYGEPTKAKDLDHRVRVSVGKHSGRVYSVMFPVEDTSERTVKQHFAALLRYLHGHASRVHQPPQSVHYQSLLKALRIAKEDLLADLSGKKSASSLEDAVQKIPVDKQH